MPLQPPKPVKDRTLQQNKALHLYFRLVAEALNEAGLDIRAVLKPEVEIPWSPGAVKEFLWRPVQKILLQKESTRSLTTSDIDKVYDVVNAHLAKHGIHEPFPSIEQLMNADLDEQYEKVHTS